MNDKINPSHYKGKVECIDAIEACMSREEFIGYLRGSVIKYNWRFRNKGGIEDLNKSKWFIDRLIKVLGSEE